MGQAHEDLLQGWEGLEGIEEEREKERTGLGDAPVSDQAVRLGLGFAGLVVHEEELLVVLLAVRLGGLLALLAGRLGLEEGEKALQRVEARSGEGVGEVARRLDVEDSV